MRKFCFLYARFRHARCAAQEPFAGAVGLRLVFWLLVRRLLFDREADQCVIALTKCTRVWDAFLAYCLLVVAVGKIRSQAFR